MADLFNLDMDMDMGAEILADQDDQAEEEQGEEWNDQDAEQVEVATATLGTMPTTTPTTPTTPATPTNLPDRVDLEDIAASTTTQDLDYTKLYSVWMQETQSPELLPFPTELVERIRKQISLDNSDESTIDTGNEGLDALLTSLIAIDTDRVCYLLADWLKCRLQKMEAHPFDADTDTTALRDCMSPEEQSFCQDYRELVQQHLHQTVTQHFPDRENWRHVVRGKPDLEHVYCFAYCVDDVQLTHGPGDVRPQAAGNRIIVRYNKIKQHVLEGTMVLI